MKNFVNNFSKCPLCEGNFAIEISSYIPVEKSTQFHGELVDNKLKIKITTGNYIKDTENPSMILNILWDNGKLFSCEGTNEFVSLYDLNLLICKKCVGHDSSKITENKCTFFTTINLFYDTQVSKFTSRLFQETFAIPANNDKYVFSNCYYNSKSLLAIIGPCKSSKNKSVTSSIIPFNKFDFKNKKKVLSRLNSIRLLT